MVSVFCYLLRDEIFHDIDIKYLQSTVTVLQEVDYPVASIASSTCLGNRYPSSDDPPEIARHQVI